MNVVGNAVNFNRHAFKVFYDSAEISVSLASPIFFYNWQTISGCENNAIEKMRIGHCFPLSPVSQAWLFIILFPQVAPAAIIIWSASQTENEIMNLFKSNLDCFPSLNS